MVLPNRASNWAELALTEVYLLACLTTCWPDSPVELPARSPQKDPPFRKVSRSSLTIPRGRHPMAEGAQPKSVGRDCEIQGGRGAARSIRGVVEADFSSGMDLYLSSTMKTSARWAPTLPSQFELNI